MSVIDLMNKGLSTVSHQNSVRAIPAIRPPKDDSQHASASMVGHLSERAACFHGFKVLFGVW